MSLNTIIIIITIILTMKMKQILIMKKAIRMIVCLKLATRQIYNVLLHCLLEGFKELRAGP
jgi:hypothetical protein